MSESRALLEKDRQAAQHLWGVFNAEIVPAYAVEPITDEEIEEYLQAAANREADAITALARAKAELAFELAALLGYPPTQATVDGQLRHTRFEDWLADPQSITEYHRIQKLRENGERVEPYELTFRTTTGTVSRTVVSSVVPGTVKGSLPETFGILI